MFRTMFLLIKLAIALLIISVIGLICIVTFVDPNQYKNDISNLLEKATHRKVNIYGNLQWSLTPHLSINAQNLSLGNSQGFEGPLLTIKDANIQIVPLELIKGKLVVNGLDIQGLAIKIIIDKSGASNLDDIFNFINSEKLIQSKSELNKHLSIASSQSVLFKKVKLNKVKLLYENEQTKQNWVVNLNAQTTNLELKKYLKSLPSIHIEGEHIDIKNPKYMRMQVKGTIQYLITENSLKLTDFGIHWNDVQTIVNGKISIFKRKDNFKISVQAKSINETLKNLELRVLPTDTTDILFNASISIDDDELVLNTFKLKLNNNEKYTGHTNLPFDKKQPISLNIESFTGNLRTINNFHTGLISISSRIYPIDSFIPKDRSIKARLTAYSFAINNTFSLDSMHSKFEYNNELLQLSSFSIEAINSNLQATGVINFNKSTPSAAFSIKSSNLSMSDISSLLKFSSPVSGRAQAIINCSVDNLNLYKWATTVSGSAQLDIEEGIFSGYSMNTILEKSTASLKAIDGYIKDSDNESLQKTFDKTITPEINNPENKTNFNQAIVDMNFSKGNYDLRTMKIVSDNFSLSGSTTISLTDKKVSGKLDLTTSSFKDAINLNLDNTKSDFFIGGKPAGLTFYLDDTRLLKRSAWLLQRNIDQEHTKSLIEGLVNSVPNTENE
ncbi:MAG: AsmA family protein [Francisellaceae bacterium]|nr:AsmA family protein [Francisellaceae bacterium]